MKLDSEFLEIEYRRVLLIEMKENTKHEWNIQVFDYHNLLAEGIGIPAEHPREVDIEWLMGKTQIVDGVDWKIRKTLVGKYKPIFHQNNKLKQGAKQCQK